MAQTLKQLGVDVFKFSKSREDEAYQKEQSLRLTSFLQIEGETFNWTNVIARPELLEIKTKQSQKYNHQQDFENELKQNEQENPHISKSFFIFDSNSPFRLSLSSTLRSKQLTNFLRFITLLNVATFCAYDYQQRVKNQDFESNRICISIEVFCNIFFGLEFFAQTIVHGFVLGQNTYLKSWWNIINFATFISSWSILSDINSNNQIVHILRFIRIFRSIRLIQDSQTLKKQMDAFVGSFSRLGPILIPLLFVVLYYSIIGLHLFMGLTEYRCRESPHPEGKEWVVAEGIYNLCGAWNCPERTYCGSPADYGLPRNFHENQSESLGFNFIRFDDFFHSLFVVFLYISMMGWSGTNFMFWKAMNTYVTAFYFVSLIFILAYVLSNLLLASFYESFLVFSSIKQNKMLENEKEALEHEILKKKQQQMMMRLAQLNEQKQTKRNKKRQYQVPLYYEEDVQDSLIKEQLLQFQHISSLIVKSNYFKYFNSLIILISTIVIISDADQIKTNIYEFLLIVDFICIVYFILELILTIMGNGIQAHFKEIIDILDFLVIISQVVLIIVLFFMNENIIINHNRYVNLFKALKMLRLMKFLYMARIFYSISVLAKCLIQTLTKIKDMILLFLAIILLTSLFGQELLAYKVLFEQNEEGELEISNKNEGVSASINYEGFGNAFMAATNIFYNEEQHVTMMILGQKTWVSFIYHIIFILLGQQLFVRLLTAVFLNEFCKQLKKIEQDFKPINFLQYGQKIIQIISNCFIQRRRAKVQNILIQKQGIQVNQINQQLKPIKLSIFHDLKTQHVQKLSESHNNEINEYKIQTPSNIFSNKESMIDPLKQNQVLKLNRPSLLNNEIQDHNIEEIEKENQNVEDEDSNEQDKLQSPGDVNNPVTTQNLRQSIRNTMRKQHSEKTLFVFAPESDFRMLVTKLVTNLCFRIFNFVLILLTCIRIALLSPLEDPNSDLSYILQIGYIFLTVFYVLVILLNCIAFGLYKTEISFFRQSIYNIFSFAITIADLITLTFSIQHPLTNFIISLRILQFIQIGAVFSKNIAYAQTSLFNAFAKMIQLTIFCLLILTMYGVFALKLQKGLYYHCVAFDKKYSLQIINKSDCFDYGGSWINEIFNFDTIFQSILMLFCTATSENWLPLVRLAWSSVGPDKEPIPNNNRFYAAYFQVFFFLGNLCLLNMFIGLIVNAYQEAKMKAQNLHLLDETQREWFTIKLQIYKMQPLVKSKRPENSFRKLLFFMVKQKHFKILWLSVIFCNTIVLAIQFHRQDPDQKRLLEIINSVFCVIFCLEILCRFFAKEKRLYFKDFSNILDIIGIWWVIANLFIRDHDDYNFYFKRISNAFSIACQLQRNFRIIKRFNNLEKLFSSIFSVIPNALSMLFIMFIFLFIYTSLGIDMFAFIRTQNNLNGWDQHFRTFSTAMFSLIKVASSEYWWSLFEDTLRQQQPDYACSYISTYNEFLQYGYNGCGTKYAYLYFLTFHIIFSLVILNLFIAAVLGAYEEHVKSEESAVSKYQLNDVLSLWRNYDPEGKGFINYKDFWKLSSEIAIIFGVAQDDLLDVNNKKNFLKVLNIPIYESKESNMLCYKFHDVILSLTKISVTLKYGVANLEPTDKTIQQKLFAQLGDLQNKNIVSKFTPTSFNSGDMVAIIYIQKKFRLWKKRVQVMRQGGDVKAIYNEMSDLKNMIKKQLEIEEQQEKKIL